MTAKSPDELPWRRSSPSGAAARASRSRSSPAAAVTSRSPVRRAASRSAAGRVTRCAIGLLGLAAAATRRRGRARHRGHGRRQSSTRRDRPARDGRPRPARRHPRPAAVPPPRRRRDGRCRAWPAPSRRRAMADGPGRACTVNGERCTLDRRAAQDPRRLPARGLPPHRHAPRVRARRVRRVHGARRRRGRAVVPHVRGAGRRRRGHDDRGHRRPDGELVDPVQAAFRDCHGLQCGFCTPGFVVSVTALLRDNPDPTDDEIRDGLSGNLCRCTGYQGIIAAVRQAAVPRPRCAHDAELTPPAQRVEPPRPHASSASPSAAARTRGCSPAAAATSTTSTMPRDAARRTSCAARSRVARSTAWTSRRRANCRASTPCSRRRT